MSNNEASSHAPSHHLKSDVAAHSSKIAEMSLRMNGLRDEIESLKHEIQRLKKDVAADITYITDKIN